jgi:predicted CXXCH cytochrome family protein
MHCAPESRYKVLSFFFDGVPEPKPAHVVLDSTNHSPKIMTKREMIGLHETTLTFHPPFQNKECENCHERRSGNRLVDPLPDLCYNCHDNFSDEYDYVHGPVRGGFCTECHNPHSSMREKLLVRDQKDLCVYCHQSGQILNQEIHEDVTGADCLDCHNPHGGNNRYLTYE